MSGTYALIRLALRRDRLLLPAWIIGLTAMVSFSVFATKDLYPTKQSLVSASETINATAALVALYGKVYDPSSIGALSLIKLTAFGAALIAILFVFITVRHTRAEEEAGRLELVSAAVVGRFAPLAAALIVGALASVTLGVLTVLGLIAAGLPWAGAASFGLGWAASGVIFTAIAGVAAQLTTSARAAIGLGMIAIAVAYVLRAVGDLATADPGWLSWLSPIGWSQQIRPFAGNRWWIAGIPLIASVLLVPVAFWLRSHRDLGSGLVSDRPGPPTGHIHGVFGLAWRLQRGLLGAWLLGAALMGLVLGSIAHDVNGLLSSPTMRKYIVALGGEQGLTNAFLAAEISILGSLVAAYAISAASRLRTEEVNGLLEPLLATGAGRIRWAWSHYGLALAGVAAVLLLTGAAIGVAHGVAVGGLPHQLTRLVGAAAAQIPAAWVLASLVLALFGWAPRWVAAAWGVLVAAVVLGEFGVLWNLPQWVLDLSPFQHSPRLPGASVEIPQLGLLLLVGLTLAIVGFVGWHQRDVPE